jgi:hypothetical protein
MNTSINPFSFSLKILGVICAALISYNCGSSNNDLGITDKEKETFKSTEADTVEIADEESNYEIIIIEPGFNVWLQAVARPPGYYSQNFLENRNRFYVIEWNNRVINTMQFDPQLYQLQIDYNPLTDYGYDVNYKLYNYFIYFQRKYNQRLGPFAPRI